MRASLLTLVATPDRAFLAFLVGCLLIYRELARPGRVLPGILGAVAAISALYALASYKLSFAGIGLATAGLMLVLLQGVERLAWIPGIAGTLCLFAGVRLALAPPWRISIAAASAVIPFSVITIALLRTAVRARRSKMRV